ncbi:uncharacterized protein LOC128226543 isoform X3 [Mya arenaria]|uniref:uncharacterized protein LOC128226543 isoform X3 n=1 Tax=Mya arenaria TaxID=6604 RepID=UPI0022E34866|nr:uncharacterized protein LOC128226543 isoform X3 [Mya arenaria]
MNGVMSSGNGDEPLRRSRRVRKQPARYGSTDRACQELSKKNTRSSSPDESTISNLLNKAGETCPLPVPASENTVPVSENSITINQSKAQISCEDDVTESLSVNSQTAPHDHEPTNSGSSTNSQILESDFSENNQIVDAILDEPEIASFDLTGLESIFHNYSADQASLSSTTDPDALSETVIESVASSVESTVVETNIANSPLINSQTVVSSTDSPNTNSPKASTENSFNANETEIVTKDKPGTPTVTHDIPKTQTVTQKTPSHTSAETAIQDPSRKEFVTQAKPVTQDFWSSKLIFNCCEKHGTAVSVKESVLDKPQISNMPFFDRLQEIMPCTRFILSNVRKSMFLTFKVPLWSDVTQKWPGVKMEDVKVFLRLMKAENGMQDDFIPAVMVKLNQRVVKIMCSMDLTKKYMMEHKPIDITSFVDMSVPGCQMNYITVENHNSLPSLQGCLTVWLVRKQTIEEMIEDIKVSQVSHPEHTHDMVRKHFEGGDPDIATTSLKALLTCPIGKTRLTVPCRGRTCVHVQCLDATTMLSMNAKKQRWRCPLCSSETAYKDIIIDGLFMDILEEVNKLVEEVEFLADGMWTSKKRNDSCISINDDTLNETMEKLDIIDLTETDDEATPKKKLPLAVNNQLLNGVNNNWPIPAKGPVCNLSRSTNIVSTTDKENNLDSVFTVNSGENRSRCTSNTSCCNEQDRSNSNTNQHHRNNYNARQRQRNNSNNSNHSNNGNSSRWVAIHPRPALHASKHPYRRNNSSSNNNRNFNRTNGGYQNTIRNYFGNSTRNCSADYCYDNYYQNQNNCYQQGYGNSDGYRYDEYRDSQYWPTTAPQTGFNMHIQGIRLT